MLARRDLYKRALIISRLFVRDIDVNESVRSGFERLLACGRSTRDRDALRCRLFDKAKEQMEAKRVKEETKDLRKRFVPAHVLLDIPVAPIVEETKAVMVAVSSESSSEDRTYVPLGDVFPIEKSVDAYNAIKWRGHVFAIDEAVPYVNRAALSILSAAPYNLRFTAQATELCKIGEGPISGNTTALFPP